MLVPQVMPSRTFMDSIRTYEVPSNALAIWFLGQNGFLLKDASGLLIAIDLYLSDSCVKRYSHLPFRLNRQLPVFVEPEDLDVDVFITTHSHQDDADPETLHRLLRKDSTDFIGPWGIYPEILGVWHLHEPLPFDSPQPRDSLRSFCARPRYTRVTY